jgi:hypothetical protein
MDENSMYEKKMGLMEEQIKSLTADLKRKVNLDKRKIKFAKDQLNRYESRLNNYGQVGLQKKSAVDFLQPCEEPDKPSVHEVNVIGS